LTYPAKGPIYLSILERFEELNVPFLQDCRMFSPLLIPCADRTSLVKLLGYVPEPPKPLPGDYLCDGLDARNQSHYIVYLEGGECDPQTLCSPDSQNPINLKINLFVKKCEKCKTKKQPQKKANQNATKKQKQKRKKKSKKKRKTEKNKN
jgi:hypothetical protein